MDRIRTQLKTSWVEENLLRKHMGFKAATAFQNLLVEEIETKPGLALMKEKLIQELKKKNAPQRQIDRIQFGQPQGLNPRIYAPINEIKERMSN